MVPMWFVWCVGPAVAHGPPQPELTPRQEPPTERWSVDLNGRTWKGTRITQDGPTLAIPVSHPTRRPGTAERPTQVVVLGTTGDVVAHLEQPIGSYVSGVAATEYGWIVQNGWGWLYRYDRDGTLVWQRQHGDYSEVPSCEPMVVDGRILMSYAGFRFVDPASGRLLRILPGHYGPCTRLDITGDGVLDWIVGSRTLRAFDGRGWRALWEVPSRYTTSWDHHIVADMLPHPGLEIGVIRGRRIVFYDPQAGRALESWSLAPWGEPHPSWRVTTASWYPDAGCIVSAGLEASTDVVCVTREGLAWQRRLRGAWVTARPLVADLDGRPGQEVLVATWDGELLALDATGATVWSWRADGRLEATPWIGDLDGDERLEVLVVTREGRATLLGTEGRGDPWLGRQLGDTMRGTP